MKPIFALFALVFSASLSAKAPIAIAIHGGAGTIDKSKFTEEQEAAYRATLKEAVESGYRLLEQGGTSMDAITRAITLLEDSPFFNAGKGAVYTYEGTHELDASIMDGRTREAGAVAAVKHIKNPIHLARAVMENSVHVMLSGEGAETFAKSQGMTMVENSYFDTPHRLEALKKAKQKLDKTSNYQAAHAALPSQYKMGTVGAVALDSQGNLAAGTSTGGMTAKRFGRIGDAPIIGAGTFADNSACAVSATGHGEYFIRYAVASDICARVKYQNRPLKEAAATVIHDVLLPAGGTGGVIAISPQGEVTMPFNTKGMYRAAKTQKGETYVAIFADE